MIHCGDKIKLSYPTSDYYGNEEHLTILGICRSPVGPSVYYMVCPDGVNCWIPDCCFIKSSLIPVRGTLWNRILNWVAPFWP